MGKYDAPKPGRHTGKGIPKKPLVQSGTEYLNKVKPLPKPKPKKGK